MQEITLNLDHENFYCPVTGALIRNQEMYEPSAATAFAFLDDIGDFQTLSPEYQKLAAAYDETQHEEGLFEWFKKQIADESIVCFNLNTFGFGCGPVCSTLRIGIDMNFACEPDEE